MYRKKKKKPQNANTQITSSSKLLVTETCKLKQCEIPLHLLDLQWLGNWLQVLTGRVVHRYTSPAGGRVDGAAILERTLALLVKSSSINPITQAFHSQYMPQGNTQVQRAHVRGCSLSFAFGGREMEASWVGILGRVERENLESGRCAPENYVAILKMELMYT